MDRREFIKYSAMTAAGVALSGYASSAAEIKKPNIIVIMADDLGYGDLSCFGSEAIRTPHIDAIAEQGMKFTSFYSSSPVCSPSRCGLLTGRYPSRVGINGVYFPSTNPGSRTMHLVAGLGDGMNPNEIVLAELLKKAGYKTCCVGKWHLGDKKKFRPNHRGFDHYLGLHYSNDMTPLPLYRNDEIIEPDPVNQDTLTGKYTDEAVTWLKQNGDNPFFLYLPHTFPHEPLHASKEFRGRSKAGLYGDCVEEVDWSIGEVLKTVDELGVADNTFVFFTSDNGPWFQGSPGIHRDRKGTTFDGGMRVPGIAKWPGVIKPGSETHEMAMNIDLFSTALAVAGVAEPDDRIIDGRSLLPVFEGGKSPHDMLCFYYGKNLLAIREGNWKYHCSHTHWATEYAIIPYGPALYDLSIDHNESYDVSDKYPDVAKRMQEKFQAWEADFKHDVPGKS